MVCCHKKGTWERRKEKDQWRREGGSSKGKGSVCPQPRISFFGSRVLGLRSSPSWLKYQLLRGYEEAMCEGSSGNGLLYAAKAVPLKDYFTYLLSESSTIKGLLYAGWRSRCKAVARKVRTIALEQSVSKNAIIWQATINLYSRVGYPWWFLLGLYCIAWLTQESVSLRIFVRKKGMSHVQSNGRAQETPSARFGKEKIYQWWSFYQVPTSVLLLRNPCSRNMGAHVQCTSAKKLVSSDFTKILEVATKIRETCEKTLFTPSSPV